MKTMKAIIFIAVLFLLMTNQVMLAQAENQDSLTTAKRDDYKIRVPPTFRSNPANRDGVYAGKSL